MGRHTPRDTQQVGVTQVWTYFWPFGVVVLNALVELRPEQVVPKLGHTLLAPDPEATIQGRTVSGFSTRGHD